MSETYYEKRKARKLAEKQAVELKGLAASILTEQTPEEEVSDIPEIEPEEVTKPKGSDSIPGTEESTPEVIAPVVFSFGRTKDTAIVIDRHIQEMYNILGNIFGAKAGDYFIGSENTMTITSLGKRKRMKCVLIEDKNGFKYAVWFDISRLGPVF